MKKCDVCGRTEKECKIKMVNGVTMCPKHLTGYYRNNKRINNSRTIYDKNEIELLNDCAIIHLYDKNCNEIGTSYIDKEDVDKVSKYKWHVKDNGKTKHVVTSLPNGEKIFLHRLVLDYNGNLVVDHIDHNGLNNRKSNLRICSVGLNIMNQIPKNRGIFKVKSGRYRASITKDYKSIYIGTFDTYEEALAARIKKEKELFE